MAVCKQSNARQVHVDCGWQHYTLFQSANAAKKAVNTVQYLKPYNAMIESGNRITAHRTGCISLSFHRKLKV